MQLSEITLRNIFNSIIDANLVIVALNVGSVILLIYVVWKVLHWTGVIGEKLGEAKDKFIKQYDEVDKKRKLYFFLYILALLLVGWLSLVFFYK